MQSRQCARRLTIARSLRLAVPQLLLAQAAEVVEQALREDYLRARVGPEKPLLRD
jgi:hypothetical protein